MDDEYAKLPPYDGETWEQPIGLFHCHTQPELLCAGWVGCHDMLNMLSIRLHWKDIDDAVTRYVSPVPLFESGAEAAAHGKLPPDEAASKMIGKLIKVVARRTK